MERKKEERNQKYKKWKEIGGEIHVASGCKAPEMCVAGIIDPKWR